MFYFSLTKSTVYYISKDLHDANISERSINNF